MFSHWVLCLLVNNYFIMNDLKCSNILMLYIKIVDTIFLRTTLALLLSKYLFCVSIISQASIEMFILLIIGYLTGILCCNVYVRFLFCV